MVQATQSDISTLCGQNMLLWMQYLELVTFNKQITHQLAKEHHLHRVGLSSPVILMLTVRHLHRCYHLTLHYCSVEWLCDNDNLN